MNRNSNSSKKDAADDNLRPEYDLTELFKKGVRGKYAKRFQAGTNLVLLEPDIARAFPTDHSVNETLRLAIQLTRIPNHKKKQYYGKAVNICLINSNNFLL